MTATTDAAPGADETDTDTDQSWRELSSCRRMNPDLFFSGGGASHKAKKVCFDECPVREMCLALALENDERFGIWGGLTRAERAKLQREQKEDEKKKEPASAADPVAA